MKNRNIEFNLKEWEKEFVLANPNPEDNSDFDDDAMVDLDKVVNKGNIA